MPSLSPEFKAAKAIKRHRRKHYGFKKPSAPKPGGGGRRRQRHMRPKR